MIMLNNLLFEIICTDTCVRCITHTRTIDDDEFISCLPDRAEYYGYDREYGICLQERFRALLAGRISFNRDILKDANVPCDYHPKKRRAPRRPFVADPRVAPLYKSGHSIRNIARSLGISKKHVERIVKHSDAADNLFVKIFKEMLDDGTL